MHVSIKMSYKILELYFFSLHITIFICRFIKNNWNFLIIENNIIKTHIMNCTSIDYQSNYECNFKMYHIVPFIILIIIVLTVIILIIHAICILVKAIIRKKGDVKIESLIKINEKIQTQNREVVLV
jgi:hypothetical protein